MPEHSADSESDDYLGEELYCPDCGCAINMMPGDIEDDVYCSACGWNWDDEVDDVDDVVDVVGGPDDRWATDIEDADSPIGGAPDSLAWMVEAGVLDESHELTAYGRALEAAPYVGDAE